MKSQDQKNPPVQDQDLHQVDIYAVLIYQNTVSRSIAFLLLVLGWGLSFFTGWQIGHQLLSAAVALKYGVLPFAVFVVGYLLLIIYSYVQVRTHLKEQYGHLELKTLLETENEILSDKTLNFFSAIGMGGLFGDYGRRLIQRRSWSLNSKDEKGTAAVFFVLFFIILHWWFLLMMPFSLAKAVDKIYKRSFAAVITQIFWSTWFWFIIFYVTTVFMAGMSGATAIDFTKP